MRERGGWVIGFNVNQPSRESVDEKETDEQKEEEKYSHNP